MGRAEDIFGLLVSDGIDAVNEFIASERVEELFLDYKRSADHGRGTSLDNKDRQTFSKAISGFGNSEGGVLLWGVECSRNADVGDVPTTTAPIQNPIRFQSWLEGAASGLTIPAHNTVRSHAIEIGDGTGVVATLIPKSDLVPHQTVKPLVYYMRAGSNFEPVPHSVLAGMFGRRPQPSVFPVRMVEQTAYRAVRESIDIRWTYLVRSNGPGIAEDIYQTFNINSTPGAASPIVFDAPHEDYWTTHQTLGISSHNITKAGVLLPPQAQLKSMSCYVRLAPPFEGSFSYDGLVGCSGSPPHHYEGVWRKDQIEDFFAAYKNGITNNLPADELRTIFKQHIEL